MRLHSLAEHLGSSSALTQKSLAAAKHLLNAISCDSLSPTLPSPAVPITWNAFPPVRSESYQTHTPTNTQSKSFFSQDLRTTILYFVHYFGFRVQCLMHLRETSLSKPLSGPHLHTELIQGEKSLLTGGPGKG